MSDAVDVLDVQVWADLVCPWCYIAERRLAEAVAGFAGPVAVRHRAYELDPGMPSGERDATAACQTRTVALAPWSLTATLYHGQNQ